MQHARTGWGLAAALCLLLAGCGGGGGSGGGGPANVLPNANAGAAQSTTAGTTITLNGSASSDPDGTIAAYAWTQTGGTAVTLSSTSSSQPTFVAPQVSATTTLNFQLTVTDNFGAARSATTTVTVNPVPVSNVLSGTVRFARVQFRSTSPFTLDYANPVMRPARGVTVRALDPTSLAELASTTTDANGAYGFSMLAPNITILVEVRAQMLRSGIPGWNVRVQSGTSVTAPYFYRTEPFSSGVGTRNIDIPSGIPANGGNTALANRSSGPFAILDTIYTAMQAVLGVQPAAVFPELVVDWGVQNEGTHFSTEGVQHISLLSNLAEDTEEFDQHIVAHEYGHYIEHNFSRSDNFGGSHSTTDRLDMRVSFSEGFSHAFAAIILNDPVMRDSYVSGGPAVSSFNIESNPGLATGCWCSQLSVAAILWDIHDNLADAGDGLSLGFAPIWAAMTGAHRTTPALTSIFTFVTALKASAPASVAAIDALVLAQNINGPGINDFATNETNAPFPNMLPLYTTITRGVPVVVRSINDGGFFNKAGNSALLRFDSPLTGGVMMTVTTSNAAADADPDFLVYRNGSVVRAGTTTVVRTETQQVLVVNGVTYTAEAFDCANVCYEDSPTAGDYNLTVTIN